MTAQIETQHSKQTVARRYRMAVCVGIYPKPDPTGGNLPASGGDGSKP